jgi:hypothetical protein
MSPSFLNFFVPCYGENIIKFLLASTKIFTNFEDPYPNSLQNACCGIKEAACDFEK